MSRHKHTLVAAFLIACCCYGTTLLAEQRKDAERAAATQAPADANDASTPIAKEA